MKEEKLDFYLNWGLKGLKISSLSLTVIIVFSILFSLRVYPLNKLGAMILSLPKTSVDFLVIFEGIILFVVLPFVIGIKVGVNRIRRLRK